MKAKLTFDTSDPDERDEFNRCVKADDMASVIWEFLYNTKKDTEWMIQEKGLTAYDVLDVLMDRFGGLLDEHGINIDDLWK